MLAGNQQERKLRVGTWNFSGLCSEHKRKEVGELLKVNNINVVAGQESWEKEDSRINVDEYKWFGKPSDVQNGWRGEGGVGFLVHNCLINEVEFVGEVKYAESVWMKVRGERGRSALYIGCVYMPTDGSGIATIDDSYNLLKDVLTFKQKEKVVLLGDFNARVGRSSEVDDVIGMFGEETCNASGNKLISFLNEVKLVVCNGRKLAIEPEWTRVRPSLKQKSIIDYIITSGDVLVDSVDVGCSDHFLLWMELGIACKLTKSRRRMIKK